MALFFSKIPRHFLVLFLIFAVFFFCCGFASAQFYRDSEDNLRMFVYGEELFAADAGGRTFVSSDGNRVVRKYYDDLFRLEKSETWDMSGGSSDAAVVAVENFSYAGDAVFPVSSTYLSQSSFSEKSYDTAGRVTNLREYRIDGENSNRILENNSSWKYSSDGNLIEMSYQKMSENGKKVVFARRELYKYKADKNIPPDYELYEDNKIRTKTVYSSADSYESVFYFDSGYSVVEIYEGGRKISETTAQGESVIRKQTYDR